MRKIIKPPSRQERRKKLIQQIEIVFAGIEYPGDDRLVYSLDWPDYWELLNDFKGKHWKKLPSETLVRHVYDLLLFSHEGFRFYLPAYLLAALRGKPIGDFWEFTFYSLVPPETGDSRMDYFVDRMQRFDTAQKALLRAFVELFIETESLDPNRLHDRTRKFWENY